MSIWKAIHEAVDKSRFSEQFTLSEDPGKLQLSGILSRDTLDLWQSIFDQKPDWLRVTCIDDSQDTVQPREVPSERPVRLNVSFTPLSGSAHLFTVEGFRTFLRDDELVSKCASIRLAFDQTTFRTLAFEVGGWKINPADCEVVQYPTETSPRRFVRSHSPEFMPPSSVNPWICLEEPAHPSQAWSEWKSVATEMLVRCLPNELFTDQGRCMVALAGQPPRTMLLGPGDVANLNYEQLSAAVRWTYTEGTDIEVRHTFLAAELAREWPKVTFWEGLVSHLSPALASARLLYRAHLRSGSKDTLKSLSDLRKSLAEDVQKIIQQSRDLASVVWRDVAITIGIVAVRLASGVMSVHDASLIFAGLYLLAAGFVFTSYRLNVITNSKFLKIQGRSRSEWRSSIYGFIDDDSYEKLAIKPISESVQAYRDLRRMTDTVVYITVGLLAVLLLYESYSYLDRIEWIVAPSSDAVHSSWGGR